LDEIVPDLKFLVQEQPYEKLKDTPMMKEIHAIIQKRLEALKLEFKAPKK